MMAAAHHQPEVLSGAAVFIQLQELAQLRLHRLAQQLLGAVVENPGQDIFKFSDLRIVNNLSTYHT